MTPEKSFRRLTLRQLLTHAEKSTRDIIEQLHSTTLLSISDLRDLSRPVRRRSHYPTLLAMQNAIQKLMANGEELQGLTDDIREQLAEIDDRAKREKVNRL